MMTTTTTTITPPPRDALIPLRQLAGRLCVGSPLPFDVRDAAGTLLLPRGRAVADEAMRESLLAQGAGIEAAQLRELQARVESRRQAAEAGFSARWQALLGSPADAAEQLLSLADVCPDRLVFAIIRAERQAGPALRLAGLAALLSRRAGWLHERRRMAVHAALLGQAAGLGEEVARLLGIAEHFLARHAGSGSVDRPPVPPRQAAGELYMASAGHPFAAMLVKELGVYPAGSGVQLASGEAAIVLRRGSHACKPRACVLAGAPRLRDTAQPGFAVIGPSLAPLPKIDPDRLYALAA